MNNTLGEKIKRTRKIRGLTQAALSGDKITRNMLSAIENGGASPSLETLKFLAEGLGVSVSYLVSEDDDLFFYDKRKKIDAIHRAYSAKNYPACIRLIKNLPSSDNELDYILASSYVSLGIQNVSKGNFLSAKEDLIQAEEYCKRTIFDTNHLEALIAIYSSVASNMQAPLLEFDALTYNNAVIKAVDYEMYKYLTLDYNYDFQTKVLGMHIEAKRLMKDHNYTDAIKMLLEASDVLKLSGYNAFVIFSIYTDLEYCYKQIYDYERAYLYSTKRITLLEEFKT